MDGPGEYLKRERELRGVSVEEISDYTKVSARLVRAFEADEHEKLPEPIFIKGFIRAYCRRLGLDDNDALLRYELFLKDHPEIAGARPEEEAEEAPQPRSTALIFVFFAFVGLLIILTFFLISRWSGLEKPPSEEKAAYEPAPEAAAVEVAKEPSGEAALEEEAVKEVAEKADIVKEAAPSETHKLGILAVERTWIRYIIDDGEPAEVLLQPGDRLSWEAKKGFFLRIGNAGGVYLTFDGEPLGLMGKSGEVVELSLPEEL